MGGNVPYVCDCVSYVRHTVTDVRHAVTDVRHIVTHTRHTVTDVKVKWVSYIAPDAHTRLSASHIYFVGFYTHMRGLQPHNGAVKVLPRDTDARA